jgi:hypothetical protein
MRRCRWCVALGAVVVVGMTWGLQRMLQQSTWAQETADSWGLLPYVVGSMAFRGRWGMVSGTSGGWLDEKTSCPGRGASGS